MTVAARLARLPPDAALEWAREHEWKEQHARTLHAYATAVRHWTDEPPLAEDAADHWRALGERR